MRARESRKPKAKRSGGAPQKVPGGLDRALYVRVNETVSAQLERLTAAKSKAAGVSLSKADVARGLIQAAMAAQLNDEGRLEKLEAMSMTDRIEESGSQSLMREHLTDYFAADDCRREQVSERLERATENGCDILAGDIPCGEWRHKWPPGVRQAIRALWRTPKTD